MNVNAPDRINIGADVIGSNGDKLGTVAYVVVHPENLGVTDIVVSTGAILGRDVVVPCDKVARIEDGKVYLRFNKDELEKCDDYVEVRYATPPAGWVPPPEFAYPAGGFLWPAGTYTPIPESIKVNAPPGTVGLHQGMDVVSSDDHKVGSLDGVDFGDGDQQVVALRVKEGFLFTHNVRIPADAIARVEGDRVILSLARDEAKARFDQT